MRTLNLEKQAVKLRRILEKNGIFIKSATIENGYVKATCRNEDVCYFTPDLEHYTLWDKYKFISIENGFLKMTFQNEDVCYFTLNFENDTHRGKSITTEKDYVKLTLQDGSIQRYNSNLEII